MKVWFLIKLACQSFGQKSVLSTSICMIAKLAWSYLASILKGLGAGIASNREPSGDGFMNFKQSMRFFILGIFLLSEISFASDRNYTAIPSQTTTTTQSSLPAANNDTGAMSYTPTAAPQVIASPKSSSQNSNMMMQMVPALGAAALSAFGSNNSKKDSKNNKDKENKENSDSSSTSKNNSANDSSSSDRSTISNNKASDDSSTESISGGTQCKKPDGFHPPFSPVRVTSCFSSPRSSSYGSYPHKGMDLSPASNGAAAVGMSVKAVANGKIRRAALMGGRSGHTIIMDHDTCPGSLGGACASVYRHLGKKMASAGSCYETGSIIGVIGKQDKSINGGVTPHLHLEILKTGFAYNLNQFPEIVPNPAQCKNFGPKSLATGSVSGSLRRPASRKGMK